MLMVITGSKALLSSTTADDAAAAAAALEGGDAVTRMWRLRACTLPVNLSITVSPLSPVVCNVTGRP